MDVHVAWGAGSGPTELSSYDAALADAGVGDYNLVAVSSILPADAEVSVAGTAPDLGPAGARLTVVQARATVAGPGHAVAALGWAAGPGPGIVYEASETGEGPGDPATEDVEAEVEAGLAAGRDLRDWDLEEPRVESVTAEATAGAHATAVVVATLGEGEPLG